MKWTHTSARTQTTHALTHACTQEHMNARTHARTHACMCARVLCRCDSRQQSNTVGNPKCRGKEERLKVLQKEAGWVIWCKVIPKDKGEQAFREQSQCISARNPKVIEIAERRHLEESTSQEPEAGGNVEMCLHVLPKLTWSAGCIKISSWTTIKHMKV